MHAVAMHMWFSGRAKSSDVEDKKKPVLLINNLATLSLCGTLKLYFAVINKDKFYLLELDH